VRLPRLDAQVVAASSAINSGTETRATPTAPSDCP
jgi:hypothetical protein